MEKHTPGPWKVIRADSPVVQTEDEHHAICTTYGVYATREQKEANSNLIAAAPDLLAACQGAMRIVSLWNGREVPEDHEHAEEMKALHMMQEAFIEAIAKAEGKAL